MRASQTLSQGVSHAADQGSVCRRKLFDELGELSFRFSFGHEISRADFSYRTVATNGASANRSDGTTVGNGSEAVMRSVPETRRSVGTGYGDRKRTSPTSAWGVSGLSDADISNDGEPDHVWQAVEISEENVRYPRDLASGAV
jgi:hypothetical protein